MSRNELISIQFTSLNQVLQSQCGTLKINTYTENIKTPTGYFTLDLNE
jgi:hypothetical protein